MKLSRKVEFLNAIKTSEAAIYKIASVYTDNRDDRDDLVQEIHYQIWKSFDRFSHQSSLTTWIYRVSMNVSIYHLKVSKRRVPTVPIAEDLGNARDTAPYEEKAWNTLKQAIDTLNLLDKGILILYLEEKSYEEIAEIIGISVSNVGTKLSRIRERLKQKILKQL